MRSRQRSPNKPRDLGAVAPMPNARTFPVPEANVRERRETRADAATNDAPRGRPGWLERLDFWFWTQQQRDFEAYGAKAMDAYDFATSIRAPERNVRYARQ